MKTLLPDPLSVTQIFLFFLILPGVRSVSPWKQNQFFPVLSSYTLEEEVSPAHITGDKGQGGVPCSPLSSSILHVVSPSLLCWKMETHWGRPGSHQAGSGVMYVFHPHSIALLHELQRNGSAILLSWGGVGEAQGVVSVWQPLPWQRWVRSSSGMGLAAGVKTGSPLSAEQHGQQAHCRADCSNQPDLTLWCLYNY